MPSGLKNRSKWAVKRLNQMCFACARACMVIYCRSGRISKKWCCAFGNQTNKYMLCLFCPPTLPFCPPLYLPPHRPHRTRIRMRCMSMVTASYAGGGWPNGCSSRVGPWVWGLPATSAPCNSQRRRRSLPLPSLRDVGDQHWWRGVTLGTEGDDGMEGDSEEGDGDDDDDNDWYVSSLSSVLNHSAAPSAVASFPPHSTSPNIDPTGHASVCNVCLWLPPRMQVVASPMGVRQG